MLFQQGWQSVETVPRSIAGNAGINDGSDLAGFRQFWLNQARPAFLNRHLVASAKAIAEYKKRLRRGAMTDNQKTKRKDANHDNSSDQGQ